VAFYNSAQMTNLTGWIFPSSHMAAPTGLYALQGTQGAG